MQKQKTRVMQQIEEMFTEQQQLFLKLLADGFSFGEIGNKFIKAGYGDKDVVYFKNMINEIKSLTGCKTEYRLAVLTERKKWLEQIQKSIEVSEKEAWNKGFAEGLPRGIWRGIFYGSAAVGIAWAIKEFLF